MKKIRSLSESNFLKLFFAFITASFLIAAVCMPDRAQMFSGLWKIMSSPTKLSTNFFSIGGFAATFLNMGLVCLAMTLLFVLLKATATNVSTLAFLLTVGFSSWGINVLNMWPSILGVVIYSLVKKEKLASLVNAMLFSTGVAPVISELLLRYPNAEVVGFNLLGAVLAVLIGAVIGFFLPAGLAHSPNVHKGFDLYSAAVPVGMTAFFLNAVLYNTMGIKMPAALGDLSVASPAAINIFCGTLFGLCIVFAFVLGCKPKDYWQLLKDPALVTNFSSTYGNAVFLMNAGVYGLFILGYYNLIGANFNAVTLGLIFCMASCCNSGSHPANVWPIMLGYVAASFGFGAVSKLLGGNFTLAINAPGIAVGLCFANGLSPIADKYGWRYGFIAAVLHYALVTTVPNLHGGLCLYNGGLTAALVCLLFVPELERFFKTKEQRKEAKQLKSK